MVMREQDKHFLWALYYGVGVILIWKGIWESFYEIPYIGENPWALLFIGLAMLTLSGLVFKELDPMGSLDKAANKMLHFVHNHPKKKEFTIKYQQSKKEKSFAADKVSQIEKGYLAVEENGRELFIPIHRVTEVLQKGRTYWRL